MSDSVRPHRQQPTRPHHPGILQARTLEWVAISSSNAGKWKVKVKSLSRVRRLATPWTAAYQAPPSMGFSRQEYWSGFPWDFRLVRTNPENLSIFSCICRFCFLWYTKRKLALYLMHEHVWKVVGLRSLRDKKISKPEQFLPVVDSVMTLSYKP